MLKHTNIQLLRNFKIENYLHRQAGFTLIELLIAIGLAALFIPALVFVLSFSLSSASQGENYTKAYTLAQEQMEIVYHLKDQDPNWDWENYPENNSETDYYQPIKVGNEWNLGPKTSSPEEVDNYVKTVKVLPVSRIAGNIDTDPAAIPDPYSRKIIINISWRENGQPTNIDLVSYVSKH